MKICDLTFLYFPRGGGIKTYIDTKRAEYKKRNIDHCIIAPSTKKHDSVHIEVDGSTRVYYVPTMEITIQGVKYFFFRHFKDIEEILKKEMPHVIEIGDKFTTLFFHEKIKKLKKKIGAKVYVFSHERADNFINVAYDLYRKHSFANKIKNIFFLSFEKVLLKKFVDVADVVLCNSELTADELRPFAPGRVKIVSLGIEGSEFSREKYFDQKLRDELTENGKKKVLIHVGRIDKEKKIDLLVDFWKRIDCDRYSLVVVGGGTQESELKKIPCAKVTGYVKLEIVKKYLCASDLGVLVNDIEPFGLVALEMMAVGLPILGPDKGGLSGILKDHFSWRLPHNADAYIQALQEWEARDDKAELGKNALKEFNDHYTSSVMVDSLLSIYSA